MLNWEKDNHCYIGFDDDTAVYYVRTDENGWYWTDVDGYGYGGFESPEEAMADAEREWAGRQAYEEEGEGFTLAEMEEILGDLLFEENREQQLFPWLFEEI